jgi:translation initiation factor 1 (eIF-1/SUI1)
MTENKRYRKVMGLIENTDGETFDLSEIEDLLNEQEEIIIEQSIQLDFLKNENKHMKDVLNENKQLKERIKELKKNLKGD